MSNAPTANTILGTLVDRAVCMPYAKPQLLQRASRRHLDEDSGRWRTVATIGEDVSAAAALLVTCLKASGADQRWSRAELVLDPAGPWWAKPRDDFLRLDRDGRNWVLDRLEGTAVRAADCLEDQAVERGWAWLWSQPSFASPGKVRPSITRPDLIGGLDRKRCDVIDLKTTCKDDLHSTVKSGQANAFRSWATSLTAMGFTPVHCVVLVVSTSDDRFEWIEFPSPDPAGDPELALRTTS